MVDSFRPVVMNYCCLIVIDRNFLIVTDPLRVVVLGLKQRILFGVQEYLFAAFLVFEPKFIEIGGSALERASGLDAALGPVVR